MSQAFDHIVQELDQISQQEKYALRVILDEKLATFGENGTPQSRPSAFGWAQGRISIAADFDAPLDDFKDFVE